MVKGRLEMREGLESAKDDFDGWVAKWEKALSDGVFGDSAKLPSTAPATSDFSFFGPRNDNPTADIDPSDSAYWRAIDSVADGGVEMQRLDEADAVSTDLPNPVRKSTEGKDQDLAPDQLGLTFDEKDISDLEGMKVKIHELGSKSAEMGDDDYFDKIEGMIKKLDDLSDRMCKPKKR
jgi:hypothetical protein